MSSDVSSPIHRYSADIESLLYDQNFTADISNKMRVPTKILVTGGGLNDGRSYDHSAADHADIGYTLRSMQPMDTDSIHDKVNTMQVPDRIILAGQEQHVGVKAPSNELRLEQMMSPQPSVVRVETPPRVLTLEDHFFPTVDENSASESDDEIPQNMPSKQTKDAASSRDRPALPALTGSNTRSVVSYYGEGELDATTTPGPIEDVSAIRRQLVKLNRRVVRLENDSQARQQRELLVYSLGVAYFVLKTFLWLHRHW